MVMMGAIMSGISKSMEDTEKRRTSELERKVRQAQIDKLLQDMSYQQQMQPLEMEAKRRDIAFKGAQTKQTEAETTWLPKKAQAEIDRNQSQMEEAAMARTLTQAKLDAFKQERDAVAATGGDVKRAELNIKKAEKEIEEIDSKIKENQQQGIAAITNARANMSRAGAERRATMNDFELSLVNDMASKYASVGMDPVSARAKALDDYKRLGGNEPMVDLSQGQPRETTGGSEGHPLVKEFSKRIGGMKLEQPWLFSLSREQEKQGMQNLTRGELKTLTPAIAAGLVSADQVIEDPAFMGAIRATEPQTYDALQQLLAERSRLEQQPKKVPASRAQDAAAAMADAERKTREINLKIRTLLQGLGK